MSERSIPVFSMIWRAAMMLGWAVLWLLLFWVSRDNHPTPLMNAAATTLMILTAMIAFAVIARTRKINATVPKYVIAALCIICAGLAAALAIHAVYDIKIGPDPRRFGLAANVIMDTAVVAVLIALMSALDWRLRRPGRNRQH